jgi:hypothetical protein
MHEVDRLSTAFRLPVAINCMAIPKVDISRFTKSPPREETYMKLVTQKQYK